jgi:2,4-dienoyl-CoA reductase-like NADH-dependent reductase (Old Yellow Enzyme family)
MSEAALFQPFQTRGVTLPNRIVMSPMCQYSAIDGFVNDWHLVHLGARATCGAGLVIVEATAVEPRGRITPGCTGLWSDEHVPGLRRIVDFIHSQGAKAGIQIGHAGRKASCAVPWQGGLYLTEGAWQTVAPSPLPFRPGEPTPHELTRTEIAATLLLFTAAARRALAAGFDLIEIHGAHGYLISEFLSPLANQRNDEYGGGFDNRVRLALETADAVRSVWPAELPLWFRVSATDWVPGGWGGDDTVALAQLLSDHGVDLLDCSSGAVTPDAKIPYAPGFQVPFAERVKREAGMPSGAVGGIREVAQAEAILTEGRADVVLLGRELLRNPYWPIRAAQELGVKPKWPPQYVWAV